jgi:hypothetical protein
MFLKLLFRFAFYFLNNQNRRKYLTVKLVKFANWRSSNYILA